MARELIFEYTEPLEKYPMYLWVHKEIDGEITITARSRVRDSNAPGICMAGNSGCMIIPERALMNLIVALGSLVPHKAKNLAVVEKPPEIV
jgi:hypothetical protein